MDYSSFNYVGSMSVAGSARVQIGNNTTNNYCQADDKKCLAALCSTNPRHDKIRIEETNGGLLKESYSWILGNPEFQRWCDPKENCPLLWIRGDPGKGKTMLLSGIINGLEPFTRLGNSGTDTSLSYFFCQATNSGLNNSAAVLRGLAYLLVEQQPCLLSHVRDEASLSPGHCNSGVAIRDILSEMLRDPALQNVIFVVDALDECITDLKFLLDFINRTTSTQVRWLVSSRNIYDIDQELGQAQTRVALSLELNEDSVSQAVNYYIQHRVRQLGVKRQFSSKDLMDAETYLSQNAHGTFLWVALVCRQLEGREPWEKVMDYLELFPPGLDQLYGRMMGTICSPVSQDLYMKILAIIATVYRPVSLSELMAIQNMPGGEDMLPRILMKCGCFLTIRDKVVYFVHQSAKDFLLNQKGAIFPFGLDRHHLGLFEKSLKGLATLKMDIYDNVYPATSMCNFRPKFPERDPLSGLAYFCQFWAHHLRDSRTICDQDPSHYNKVHQFMTDKSLFWLEALSLLKSLPAAMETLQILKGLPLCDETMDLVEDARLFFLCFRDVITAHPLQIYASGLLFSPKRSLIRDRFKRCSPKFVIKEPEVDAQWRPYLSIPGWHDSMTFSSDSKSLVTDVYGELVRWGVSDGMAIRRFKLEGLSLKTPSPDLNWFACVTIDRQPEHTVQTAIQVKRMKFSPNGQWLAVCFDKEFALWQVEKNDFKSWPLEISPSDLQGIEFSSDSTLVAIFGFSRMGSEGILVFDTDTGERYKNPNPEIKTVRSAVFSPKTHEIMMCSEHNIWSWDVTGGKCEQWLRFDGYPQHVASSHDSSWIAVASGSTIFLYEKQSQKLLRQCEMTPDGYLSSVTVSPDDKRLAACFKNSVCLWDISSSISTQAHCGRITVKEVFVSDNGSLMALALEKKIQVLDATTASRTPEQDSQYRLAGKARHG
ncbi:hypothetical protein BHE90_008686 [Fusarium euwallaceae]|uniref:NACHT domain-containing protein n=1 Tax=Fusarium euwallaceae TaxID=1147111 RepID=A0A430LMA2_9HYPO|nr:hypothetical protein BHE90_008686 [Fusarium euwallaceae]